ncbi:hypothetical protein D4764_06G0000670 [Takifugu flavidus]|uniref:Uncharacterized protein n=1 Tax=Takifugu flavidus TaxID=433684 RepID=A0A5C6MYK6_9TELE|nr:hypothetical protein D4764_06G0000670 [Takifugu flavidus]
MGRMKFAVALLCVSLAAVRDAVQGKAKLQILAPSLLYGIGVCCLEGSTKEILQCQQWMVKWTPPTPIPHPPSPIPPLGPSRNSGCPNGAMGNSGELWVP